MQVSAIELGATTATDPREAREAELKRKRAEIIKSRAPVEPAGKGLLSSLTSFRSKAKESPHTTASPDGLNGLDA